MITVWTACTGEAYDPEEVRILRRQVDRHLKQPHIFNCITEHDIEGVGTVKPLKYLPGWWIKTTLFGSTISNPRNLWLDLDVTIVGSLDELVAPLNGSQLRTAKNWAQSGHGGCQSSVMYWEGMSARVIDDKFNPEDAHWPPRNDKFWDNGQVQWGDQEWVTYLRDTGQINVEYFQNMEVCSYKYHCRENGLPPGARVVSFHGKPKPSEVSDQWVKEARQ
jgi:hypothetical protein